MASPLVQLDVRSLLAAGSEPYPIIRDKIDQLRLGQSLLLITPFLPSPLIERLQNEGFAARPLRRPDGTWETLFQRSLA